MNMSANGTLLHIFDEKNSFLRDVYFLRFYSVVQKQLLFCRRIQTRPLTILRAVTQKVGFVHLSLRGESQRE